MPDIIRGSNQGESSNEWKGTKSPYQMADVGNREGAESGVSPENEWSTTAGESYSSVEYRVQEGSNADVANSLKVGPNDASSENRAAKFKYPQTSQDQGAGANQYE